jgi:UDP:flavonoid glycosyltransferase YjiC (YdhE family)
MARFLFATFPAAGHTNPGLPIARALVERGHEVTWYAGRGFRRAIEATGAAFAPIKAAVDPADVPPNVRFPEAAQLSGLAGFKFGLKHVFLDEAPGQVADLRAILRSFPADVLVGDTGFVGMALLHELGGPPWATYGITGLTLPSRDTAPFGTGLPPSATPLGRVRNRVMTAAFERVLFRDVQDYAQGVRAQLGLPRTRQPVLSGTLSPFLYMQPTTPDFEYPRSDLPPQVHFIGPLLPEVPRDFTPPPWWGELHGRRSVVLVTQGTVATKLDDLVIPTLRALAGEDVLVVAATGGASAEEVARAWARAGAMDAMRGVTPAMAQLRLGSAEAPGPEPLPANARVAPFIPFGALLPHVDVMITNGGYGGVQFALAHGVPLIVAGATEEKPEIAARVAWSGAGIDLKTGKPSPGQIRDAVRTIRLNRRYRDHAQRIRAAYARHDAPREAAALLEHLAATGRPVLRGDAALRA